MIICHYSNELLHEIVVVLGRKTILEQIPIIMCSNFSFSADYVGISIWIKLKVNLLFDSSSLSELFYGDSYCM